MFHSVPTVPIYCPGYCNSVLKSCNVHNFNKIAKENKPNFSSSDGPANASRHSERARCHPGWTWNVSFIFNVLRPPALIIALILCCAIIFPNQVDPTLRQLHESPEAPETDTDYATSSGCRSPRVSMMSYRMTKGWRAGLGKHLTDLTRRNDISVFLTGEIAF